MIVWVSYILVGNMLGVMGIVSLTGKLIALCVLGVIISSVGIWLMSKEQEWSMGINFEYVFLSGFAWLGISVTVLLDKFLHSL